MRFLRLLFFGRWRRAEPAPIREQDAYAHSYGERTGEVLSIERMPEPEPEPESEPEIELEPEPEPEPQLELEPELEPELTEIPHGTGITGELLRRAFELKLDARHKTAS